MAPTRGAVAEMDGCRGGMGRGEMRDRRGEAREGRRMRRDGGEQSGRGERREKREKWGRGEDKTHDNQGAERRKKRTSANINTSTACHQVPISYKYRSGTKAIT